MLYFVMLEEPSSRAFKTTWFGKAAKKARIDDPALMAAILEIMTGQANIDPDELAAFRKLAQAYGRMTDAGLASALSQGDLQEIFP